MPTPAMLLCDVLDRLSMKNGLLSSHRVSKYKYTLIDQAEPSAEVVIKQIYFLFMLFCLSLMLPSAPLLILDYFAHKIASAAIILLTK
jgi:hypothetical protein